MTRLILIALFLVGPRASAEPSHAETVAIEAYLTEKITELTHRMTKAQDHLGNVEKSYAVANQEIEFLIIDLRSKLDAFFKRYSSIENVYESTEWRDSMRTNEINRCCTLRKDSEKFGKVVTKLSRLLKNAEEPLNSRLRRYVRLRPKSEWGQRGQEEDDKDDDDKD